MHDHDFELLAEQTEPDGSRTFRVLIKAARLTRDYSYFPDSGTVQLKGEPLLVAGHDMTSIIGKRVREWLRSAILPG